MATEANREAFVELQGRLLDTDKRLKQVVSQMRIQETERKRATLTLQELEVLPEGVNTFKAVGRAFVVEPLERLKDSHEGKIAESTRSLESLQASKEYLEKQMKEIETNFKELIEQSPALVQQVARAAIAK